ncbi:MAG: DUF2460 domain-containing protein [Alphaproteobacteria bacterium]|nr:DUF2460 domain-containing protein [Alphaproteobacteria bacterium]
MTTYDDAGTLAVTASGLAVNGTPITGLAWPVTKLPTFQTRIQRAVSGRELRTLDYPYPIWQFQLGVNFLRDQNDTRGTGGLGTGFNELRTLYSLYLACYGAYGTFLFSDPTDNQRTGQYLGTGNSSTAAFQLLASYGSGPIFTDQVRAVQTVNSVYLNGITQNPSTYNCPTGLNSTGVVTFLTPPATNAVIAADFTFYFRCRFVDDSLTFENFLHQLWSLKSLKFLSVFN